MAEYFSPPYETSHSVEHFLKTPRFGHTTDVSDILNGDSHDTQDYITGLLFIPIFVLVLSFLWLFGLAVLKCTCGDRFFARNKVVRGIYLLAAIAIVVIFALFSAQGNAAVNDSVDTMQEIRERLHSSFINLDGATASFQAGALKTYDSATILRNNLDSLDCDGFPVPLKSEMTDLLDTLDKLDPDQNKESIARFQNLGIGDEFSDIDADTEELLEKYNKLTQRICNTAGIIVIIMVIFFGVGCVLSWTGIMAKIPGARILGVVYSWVLLPLFVLVMVLSAVSIAVLGILSLISTDVCTGGPTESPEGTLRILLDDNSELSQDARDYLNYYIIDGCRSKNPFEELLELQSEIQDISTKVYATTRSTSAFFNDIANEGICTGSNEISNSLKVSNTTFTVAESLFAAFEKETSCEHINQIFVSLLHQAICDEFAGAVHWMFGTNYAMLMLGLIMLTTYAAFHPDKSHPDKSEQISTA